MQDNSNKHIDSLHLWQTSRRKLIKAGILAGTLSQLSFLESCSANGISEESNPHFNSQQTKLLKNLMDILFPDDGNGPGTEQLHSFKYILWVLDDDGAYSKHKNTLKDGVDWLEKYSKENYKNAFTDLEKTEQEKLVAEIVTDATGKEFCSVLLTYILESLLLDPIYGINPESIGWKWLQHTPGYPPATEELRYENILQTVRADYTVEL